jgi:hypothetical protein
MNRVKFFNGKFKFSFSLLIILYVTSTIQYAYICFTGKSKWLKNKHIMVNRSKLAKST